MTASDQADPVYPVPQRLLKEGVPKPHITSMEEYKKLWEESVNKPDQFFGRVSFNTIFFYYLASVNFFFCLKCCSRIVLYC